MSSAPDDCNQSYAKEQLGLKSGETKMLGLPWDKTEDTIAATFPEPPPEVTKREMLRFLASIYDPLGVASPVSLVGKLVYREVCDQNQSWDKKVPEYIERKWKQFEKNLPDQVSVPRPVTAFRKRLMPSIFTRSEIQVGQEQQQPCMPWFIKQVVQIKDY